MEQVRVTSQSQGKIVKMKPMESLEVIMKNLYKLLLILMSKLKLNLQTKSLMMLS